ncbi:MAG TPA: PQQ-binding-like beta-propeller repeat protein [Pyrinomonadaceae bacterium]|nr:PQQ-binding-like beta-propeller repeat protein [Pyrinomonadaceae bacterium]
MTTSSAALKDKGPALKKDDGPALSQPLTIAWRYHTDQTTDLTPAADAESVFFPLSSGVLLALNTADGKLQWKAEVGGDFSAALVADERSVYAATGYTEPVQKHTHGTLRALSKSTGLTWWMRTLPAPISGSLIADSVALFGGSVDGHVYSISKQTGQVIWSNQYAEEFSGHPQVVGNRVYFGSNAGVIRALDARTGQLVWEYKTRGPIQGAIAVKDNMAYFGSGDGNVYAFDEIRSKVRWQRRTGAAVQAIALVGNGVLASSLDNFAYLLSLNKGALIWRQQLPGRISSRPITATDGALFTPFSTDTAIVLNLRDGKPANTLSLGEENSSAAAPISVNRLVLITTPHALLAFAAPNSK